VSEDERETAGTGGSEFGRGVVVCLAKFSEHLWEGGVYTERLIREYAGWTDAERARCQAEAQRFPRGDAAQKLGRMYLAEIGHRDRELNLSRLIVMWMHGACDHFYDLDDDKAPAPLRELAALTIRIGRGFIVTEPWTLETVERIRELWRESCLALDRQLGVEPDWGTSVRFSWTQPICDDCWDAEHPASPSPRRGQGNPERCCKCGEPTASGIYIRVDPQTVDHPSVTR
jgi:hypothetical protein